MRRELRAKADEEGTHPIFKQGIYEMLRVTHRALLRLSAYMDIERERTIDAGVRNYLLSYRPDYETGKLVKAIEQPWAKELGLKEGSHRLKSSWATHRYEWLDEHGVPVEAPKPAEDLCNMEEHSYHGPEGCTVKLASWAENDEKEVEQPFVALELELTSIDDEEAFRTAAGHLEGTLRSKASAVRLNIDPLICTQ